MAVARQGALTDARAVLPGMVPFGAMLGVTVVATGADPLTEVIAGAGIYGGSAQLTALTLLGRGLDLIAVVLTAAVVNARLLMYSAAMAERFRVQPRLFRWLAPHFLIDQTYLMALGRPSSARGQLPAGTGRGGRSVLVVWTASIAAGVSAGPGDAAAAAPHLGRLRAVIGLLVSTLDRPARGGGGTGRRHRRRRDLAGAARRRHHRRRPGRCGRGHGGASSCLNLLAMLALAVLCWLFRITFVLLVPPDRLPTRVQEALTYLAPAVLGAIATVELIGVVSAADPTAALSPSPRWAWSRSWPTGSATSASPSSSVSSPCWRSTCCCSEQPRSSRKIPT